MLEKLTRMFTFTLTLKIVGRWQKTFCSEKHDRKSTSIMTSSTASFTTMRRLPCVSEIWTILTSVSEMWTILTSVSEIWTILTFVSEIWTILTSVSEIWTILTSVSNKDLDNLKASVSQRSIQP